MLIFVDRSSLPDYNDDKSCSTGAIRGFNQNIRTVGSTHEVNKRKKMVIYQTHEVFGQKTEERADFEICRV